MNRRSIERKEKKENSWRLAKNRSSIYDAGHQSFKEYGEFESKSIDGSTDSLMRPTETPWTFERRLLKERTTHIEQIKKLNSEIREAKVQSGQIAFEKEQLEAKVGLLRELLQDVLEQNKKDQKFINTR